LNVSIVSFLCKTTYIESEKIGYSWGRERREWIDEGMEGRIKKGWG
jgi:hypothetical protein